MSVSVRKDRKRELKTLRQRAYADETLADIARERLRIWIVRAFGFIAVLTLFGFTAGEIVAYRTLDPGTELTKFQTSEAERAAVKLFFDQIALVGNLSLALLGVLWAFVLQKSNRIEIRRPREYVLLVSSSLFLLASLICNLLGTNLLTERLFSSGAADITAPIVRFWSDAQLLYFGLGLFFALVTVFCCRQIDRD
jgi:hypothetical protein